MSEVIERNERFDGDKAQSIRARPHLEPYRFKAGMPSANPKGRPRSHSIREMARQRWQEPEVADFLDTVHKRSLEPTASAVRWAQLWLDIYEGSNALRVSVESSGWDSFTREIMDKLGYSELPAPALANPDTPAT